MNAARERIEAAVAARENDLERAELDRRLAEERADVTLPVGGYERGHLHLITQIRREVEDVFLGLGYRVVDGREVESTHYNFDGLNFPPGHPARSPLASLFLDAHTLLRTETSPSQVRTMEAQAPPSTSSRSAACTAATPRTRRTPRCSTRSRGSRWTRGSRSPT